MNNFMKLTVIAVLSIGLMICSLSCSKPSSTTLKIGYIPIADCGQLYVAIEKGYFKDENLTVDLVKLAGGAKILEALAGGSVDVGFTNVVSLILSKSAGLDFVAIAGGPIEDSSHAEHAILVQKDSDINSISTLAGEKIALNTRKNIDELMIAELLEKHGVDLQSVQFVEIPFPRMENMLELNQVDAAAIIEPFVTFALKNGKSKVISYNYVELYPRIEISTYVVSRSWLEKNKEVAERFARAISKATDLALQNPEELRSAVSKYTSLTSEQMQGVVLPTFGHRLSDSQLQSFADRVLKRGWMQKSVDASQLIYQFEEK